MYDQTFNKRDFKKDPLYINEFENCIFNDCNLAGVDLSQFKFHECEFNNCDLSLSILIKAQFQEVSFKGCKMLGLRFDTCDDFGLSLKFEKCFLNHSSFYELNLKNMLFKDSQLQEVDFVSCDLSSTVFDNCDLALAAFDDSILEKTDFRTSQNYSFDPEKNRIKKARFSLAGLPGLLRKYDLDIEE